MDDPIYGRLCTGHFAYMVDSSKLLEKYYLTHFYHSEVQELDKVTCHAHLRFPFEASHSTCFLLLMYTDNMQWKVK